MAPPPIQPLEPRRLFATAPVIEDLLVLQADRHEIQLDLLAIKTTSHDDAATAVAVTTADRHRIAQDVRRLTIDRRRAPQQVPVDQADVHGDEAQLAQDIRNSAQTARADLIAGIDKLQADEGTYHNDLLQLRTDLRSGI